jgi:hypothetical protein
MKKILKNISAVRELKRANRQLRLLTDIRRKMMIFKKKRGKTCVRVKK